MNRGPFNIVSVSRVVREFTRKGVGCHTRNRFVVTGKFVFKFKVEKIGFCAPWLTQENGEKIASIVFAVESGRRLARDLGGADPERMVTFCGLNLILLGTS